MDSGGILPDVDVDGRGGSSPPRRDGGGASLRARVAASAVVMDRIYKVLTRFLVT